jgi:dynein heavy chain, axonemal
MTIFIDDLSTPEMNKWGDQPTLGMVRLVIEYNGFKTGGGQRAKEGKIHFSPASLHFSPASLVLNLWKHKCERVFCGKLTNDFPLEIVAILDAPFYMVNFLRDDVHDEDGVLQEAPKMYEPGGTLQQIRDRGEFFAGNDNRDFPSKKMELVLFDDALRHLLRTNRLIEMPRGSALLVGVGGSGKQSLTRLKSYICLSWCFQITLTKSYGMNALIEDLKLLYKSCSGHQCEQTTFPFTGSEIKDEVFLELIKSILLMTGEVPGLFSKEEYTAMTADLRNAFIKDILSARGSVLVS